MTLGPWNLRPPSRTGAYIDTPRGGISIQCNGLPDSAEWQANARLIATAPELLEALKEVVSIADRKTVEFDKARAAIAKAEGHA